MTQATKTRGVHEGVSFEVISLAASRSRRLSRVGAILGLLGIALAGWVLLADDPTESPAAPLGIVAAPDSSPSVPAAPAIATAPLPTVGADALVSRQNVVTVDLAANDTIQDGFVVLAEAPAYGVAQITAEGVATYRPDSEFLGSDRFTYSACNAAGCAQAVVDVEVLPAGLSAYSGRAYETLVDTRSAEPLIAGERVRIDVPASDDVSAVVLSVTFMAPDAGDLTLWSTGQAPAPQVATDGGMGSNLVVVPLEDGQRLSLRSSIGGHAIVDLVGEFRTAALSRSGRFIGVAPERIAQLVVEESGRAGVAAPSVHSGIPVDGVSAVLLNVIADVGTDGGMVLIGGQRLMWSGSSGGDDRLQSGLALVPVDRTGEISFEYQGGSVLEVSALGYFTDESAEESRAGLFVPTYQPASDVTLQAGKTGYVPLGLAEDVAALWATVTVESESGGEVVLYPPQTAVPGLATVTARPGTTVTTAALAVGNESRILALSQYGADVSLDVVGYFSR